MMRRFRSFKILPLTLLLLVGGSAEDGYYEDDDDYIGDDFVPQDEMSGYSEMSLCSDADILVTGLYLTCDSPGTFYYGSGKYRNSDTCRAGDRAKLSVYFDIVEDLDNMDPLLTLSCKGESEEVTIYKNARLCYLGPLKSINHTGCSESGSYVLSSQFYWSNPNSNYNTTSPAFSPLTIVGFHSDKNPDLFDLGGANTDKCDGGSITTWVDNRRNDGSGPGPWKSFLWSFMILIGTIGILGMFAWYLWRRPQSLPTDSFAQHYSDTLADEDDKRIVLVGSDRGLVDF